MANNTGTNPYEKGIVIRYPNGDQELIREPYIISESQKVHSVLEGETIQSISYRYYGDSGLWGLIADANAILNPFEDIYPGMQINIPTHGR